MSPKLYGFDASPTTRSVLLTAKTLGIKIDYHKIDCFKDEHKTAEFSKINPQNTLPTLVDKGYVIWNSHAIVTYLVDKYGKDDTLYPKDLLKRALVNQRLHFDSGCVFPLIRRAFFEIKESKKFNPEIVELADVQYKFLNTFLEGKCWMAGNEVTVADFCLITSVTTLVKLTPFNTSYKNLASWVERCERLPFMEINKSGMYDVDAYLVQLYTT